MAGHSRSKNGVASLAHSRSKNGVASLAYGTRPSTFFMLDLCKDVDGRNKSGHDDEKVCYAETTARCDDNVVDIQPSFLTSTCLPGRGRVFILTRTGVHFA
jgi:hypothetical protein